jgi:cystathionine beta-lyase
MTNFDKVINRKNTNCIKWDIDKEDVIPMWVADMDFEAPEPIVEILKKKIEHKIYGYGLIPKEYYEAEIDWWEKKFLYKIEKEWISPTIGVIPAISAVIQSFSNAGDNIILLSPVYSHFIEIIENNDRNVIYSELEYEDKYEINYVDFEKKIIQNEVKIFILCNPHNPIGQIWSKEELEKLVKICERNEVLILSDEIHRDIVYSPHKHIPLISLGEEAQGISITFTAPSKTFNLAGLKVANIITVNENLKKIIDKKLLANEINQPNIFGIEALIKAYTECDVWLNELLDYLKNNIDFTLDYISKNIPQIKVLAPEATYLMWFDCQNVKMSSKSLAKYLLKKYKLRVNYGDIYGQGGEGYIRFNIACPKETLIKSLELFKIAIENIENEE